MTTACSGRHWPSEISITQDPVSGATVRQLTNYRAHSNHSDFTYPCWLFHSHLGRHRQPHPLQRTGGRGTVKS